MNFEVAPMGQSREKSTRGRLTPVYATWGKAGFEDIH